MKDELRIQAINKVLHQYFEEHQGINKVQAKELMPEFINAGIFNTDHRNGLPIRKLLRTLDKENSLHKIPFVLPERKARNTNWFFIRTNTPNSEENTNKNVQVQSKTLTKSREKSDEYYILNLCDELLKEKSARQHKFDFLLGDPDKNGICRKLPVDAFYHESNLVIEYRDLQHSEAVPHFDKPNVITVSGVSRGEQRKIYDQRRRDVLKQQGIQLIELDYFLFQCNNHKKLIRNPKDDLSILKEIFENNKILK